MRYYLHGDQSEIDPNLWYCARHDEFQTLDHFHTGWHAEQSDQDYTRLHSDLERIHETLKNLGNGYHRPPNARNCLA